MWNSGSSFSTCEVCGRFMHKACGQIHNGVFVCASDMQAIRREQAKRIEELKMETVLFRMTQQPPV